jgi:hypothetical protein
MTAFVSTIVGDFYRPLGTAVLKSLSLNFPVYLKREPENKFDSNAIAVYVLTEDILSNEQVKLQLIDELERSSCTLQEFTEHNKWHVGYVPKKTAPKWLLDTSPDILVPAIFRIHMGKFGFSVSDLGEENE